ncbi:MAG: aspartate--tRNA(Asn) ligase [Thermofilum sp.]|jgi:aspartyl-tRNA synthetase|nr:aspartate--tRNA(Asn) ligase [Thermofilum sp.]
MAEKWIEVGGWVNATRVVGRIAFLEVIDGSELTVYTVVVKRDENPQAWELAARAKVGSAVSVKGFVPDKQISKRGIEVRAREISLVAEPVDYLPLDPSGRTPALLETVMEHRYVALRIPRQRALFRIRALAVKAIREFFEERGFLEVHTPKICGAGAEGGATLFRIDYFGREAYLAQSPQLYKQMLMCGVSKVYEITPYFRAEPFSTSRHLNESWGVDAEMAFISGPEDVMRTLEGLVLHVFERVRSSARAELNELGVELKMPRAPFKRLSYSEALEILKSRGFDVKWGQDLGSDEERVLGEAMREEGYDAYFIVEYPWEAKPFYIMRRGDLSEAFDLDYRGLELASGGQREHRYDKLVENIRLKGLNVDSFSFYLEAFKYGMPPHGGFGLGLDRLIMVITGAQNIREVVLFPRDRQRLVP